MPGIRRWDKKTRWAYGAALLCMAASLVATHFEDAPWSVQHRALFDGLTGLLMGVAIGLLLFVVMKKWKAQDVQERR